MKVRQPASIRVANALFRLALLILPMTLLAQTTPPVVFNGLQTTVPISGQMSAAGVALDPSGDLFVLDRAGNQVIEIPAHGSAQKVVASGLNSPSAVASDAAGNLYITGTSPAQVIKVAVNGGSQTALPITGLASPAGMTVDAAGNLYIADGENATVVKFTPGGAQSTVGSGWSAPAGVAADTAGNIYVADNKLDHIVRIPAAGGSSTSVGNGLAAPSSVTVDIGGDVIVGGSSQVVKISPAGVQTSIGSSSLQPLGVAARAIGTVFVADGASNTVQEIQTQSVDFGDINLCAPGQTTPAPCQETLSLNYTLNAANTLAAPLIVTQGIPNLDFKLASSTCSGSLNAGATCSVNVTFQPQLAGGRAGAVQIQDQKGNLLAQTLLRGKGNGAQIVYGPAIQTSLGGFAIPLQMATDAAGNVFVANQVTSQVMKIPAGGGSPTPIASVYEAQGVAVDGAGDVFASAESGVVWEVPWTGSAYGAPVQTAFNAGPASQLAFDGAGDLFTFSSESTVVVEYPAGGGAPITFGLPHQLTSGAVDSAGDVFVASAEEILEIPASGGAPKSIVSGNFNEVAVDGAGNLFAVQSSPQTIVEFPVGGGAPIIISNTRVGTGGLTVDTAGNIYNSDRNGDGSVTEYRRSLAPPVFSFATTIVGNTSIDSPRSVQVSNIGNENLAISGVSFASGINFALTGGTGSPADCTAGMVLLPSATCNLSVTFIPTVVGDLTDALMLADNALNGTPSTQPIPLSGAGITGSEPTATVLNASTANSSYGQPVTLTATVTAALGTPVGTVTFLGGTTIIGTATINASGIASLTTSTIPAGNYAVTASYTATQLFLASTSQAITLNVSPNNVNLGSANVCSGLTKPAPCSQTMSVTYDVTANATLGTPIVVTQGIPNLDYTLSGTTCTGPVNAGSTCAVTVKFTPKFAGSRPGAVQIVGASGNILQTFFLSGIGTGAQVAFSGGAQFTVPNSPASSLAVIVDAADNLFVSDGNSGNLLKLPAGGGPAITLINGPSNSLFAGPIAVDGAGNVFVADQYTWNVVELPAGGGTPFTVAGEFDTVQSLATDAKGNLFILTSNEVIELPAGGGAQVTLMSGLQYATSIAVDKGGNVLVAYANQIETIPSGGGTPSSTPLDNYYPVGLTVDAAGDLFFIDEISGSLLEIPAGNGAPLTLANNAYFFGGNLALDGSGNLFFSVNGQALSEIQRSQPPTLSFAATTIKTVSSDSPQSVQVQNIGDAPLTLSKLKVGANFVQVAGPGTPADCSGSSSLASGAACNLSISFEPTTVGNLQSTATLNDNALNGSPATQSITLTGVSTAKIPTTIMLASSLNPSIFGQAVTFTATVTASSGATPTGAVLFKRAGLLLSSTALSNGVATLTTSTLPAGDSEQIVAVYMGSSLNIGSRIAFIQTVQKSSTSTTLTSNLNPAIAGQAVTFTATVAAASGPTPVGTVNFKRGGTLLGTALLSAGVATFTTTSLPPGDPDNITAVYTGTSSEASSTSAVLPQVVQQYATTTTLVSSVNPSAVGQAVTFTATVTAVSGPIPTGTVTFKQGSTLLGSATLANGVAVFTTSALPAGTAEKITAAFTGSIPDDDSTSTGLLQTVH
jgi:hypothetical protein